MVSSTPEIKTLLSFKDPDVIVKSLTIVEQHFCLLKASNPNDLLRPSDQDLEPDGVGEAAAASIALVKTLANEFNSSEVVEAKLKGLGFPSSYCEKAAKIVAYVSSSQSSYSSIQRLTKCDWSLDVAISSSRILKLLEPTVTLDISTNNATNHMKLELTAKEFTKLRCKVAEALKVLYAMEKKKPYAS